MPLDEQPFELKAKTFGTVNNPDYPGPVEMLHVSITHAGPGIEAMLKFYTTVLNLRLVFKYIYPMFDFIALSADDENHRVGLLHFKKMPAQPKQDLPKSRVEHVSWRWASVEDVLVTARRVREELGLWPRTARLQGRDITIDYEDPDGNRVELLTQTDTKAQILLRIQGQLGDKNGIEARDFSQTYTSFDMEKLLSGWKAGAIAQARFKESAYLMGLVKDGTIAPSPATSGEPRA